ncbi:hypothetical protein DPMN_099988 [Dreissena polymorpha]|uniref:Uncharacterized protein n=1 Tax=Dreissena polymorpha TaxID=45954 RepID=A0A9D4LIB5_DREPO|nr:hypothetical protein DPMN_099988 [Dreissena polymorpha]
MAAQFVQRAIEIILSCGRILLGDRSRNVLNEFLLTLNSLLLNVRRMCTKHPRMEELANIIVRMIESIEQHKK